MQHLTHFYGSGNLTNIPWLLTEQESTIVKEVEWKINFPTSFASNINKISRNKGYFDGEYLCLAYLY